MKITIHCISNAVNIVIKAYMYLFDQGGNNLQHHFDIKRAIEYMASMF